MPIINSESLILKTYDLAEADKIVVFLTRDHGIVRGVAKGAKRLKSKFGSTLEPFTVVNVEYFEKEDRELVTLQNIELIRSAFSHAGNPDFFRIFSYLADLLLAFTAPHDPDETLYRMARESLFAFSGDGNDIPAIRFYFELWLLRLGGYLPDWSICSRCRRKISDIETVELTDEFQIVCGNCSKREGNKLLSPPVRALFHSVQKFSPSMFVADFSGRKEDLAQCIEITGRLIVRSLGTYQIPGRSLFVRM